MPLDLRLLTKTAAAVASVLLSSPAAWLLAEEVPPVKTAPPPLDPANMDTSVKPGDDFFHYADGTWLKNNPVPPEFTRWGSFNELDERNKAILHTILDDCVAKAAKGGSDAPAGSIQQKVGDFYASGMDEAQIEAEGIKPLAAEIARVEALKERGELPALIAHLHMEGVNPMFNTNVGPDEKNSSVYIAQLGQGGLGLPDREYYLKTDDASKKFLAQYLEHVTKMLTLAGDAPEKASADAVLVVAFETDLAKASKTKVELRLPESNYHKMPVADFAKSAPGFDWNAYLVAAGATDPGEIDVQQPEFLTAVAQVAANQPVDNWRAYLKWHLVHTAAPALNKDFVNENFHFYGQILAGAKELRPRWKRILTDTDTALGEDLGQLYVAKTFTPEAKARALTMIGDLKAVLREDLGTLDWMSPETRTAAQAKLDAFTVKIGYPEKWRDYSALEIKRQPHILNVLAANGFEARRILAKIGKPVDKTEWGMTPPTVNAYYSPERNEIVFPAGILQPPFFDAKADDAVNYGGIGAVIGHEMTHGFDDQGRKYDGQGNMKNWWKFVDGKRFEERGEKIVAQFSGYEPLPGVHVNGRLTEGENIADLGGSKIAFAALEKALERQGPDARSHKIDGFTPEQRFFLSWAQVWRTNIRDETAKLLVITDPHSPAHFRVNGPLSNLPEFQKAFDIPEGSPMVRPADVRVQIW